MKWTVEALPDAQTSHAGLRIHRLHRYDLRISDLFADPSRNHQRQLNTL